MKTAAVILAAGAARRFGRPKQLLEIRGETLVSRACRIAAEAGCRPVIAVLGAYADDIRKRGLPPGVTETINERWAEGMGTSLARGIAEAAREGADAALVLLADQPDVEPATLEAMTALLADPAVSIVWCRQGGTPGPPVLFAARHFPELMQLHGDEGGRSLIRRHPAAVATLDLPGPRRDIDDEAAWRAFTKS